jgi:glycosyltransferase involved in cell wall biosynthesis
MIETRKICFLQVAHLPDDDRVWFHQTKTLRENGFDVSVVSTRTNHSDLENVFCFDDTGMKKSVVKKKILEILCKTEPNVIICDNPLSVFFAKNYKKKHHKHAKIIMDVTEWYPSKKNLVNLNPFKRFVKKTVLTCLNFYCGFWVFGFIFGEEHKAKLFRKHFKKKPYLDLPYYPDLKYITKGKPKKEFSTWKFLYSGSLNKDKGFYNVLEAMKIAAFENQNLTFVLDIVSKDVLEDEQKSFISNIPSNLEINFHDYLPYEQFCNELANYDIFLDLREKDKENNHCLPIKLFYYMACGRPAIFSDLDAIKLHVSEIDEFSCLTNPNDYGNISRIITEYVTNNEKYAKHSASALKYSNEKYNWGVLSDSFLMFICRKIYKRYEKVN